MSTYESTLNTWLAEELRKQGLGARAESAQGGGKRLDVEIALQDITIALEAEQGFGKTKKASAIRDSDARLDDDLAECAIAICYRSGILSKEELACSNVLYSLRTHKDRPTATNAVWEKVSIAELASVIRKVPDQLGEPDEIAKRLSFSLHHATKRLTKSQKIDLVQSLDLLSSKSMQDKSESVQTSKYNQASKRAMLVVATAVMFHAQLDKHRHEVTPLWDHRYTPPRSFEGHWPPATAIQCADSADPIGEFSDAWDLWLVVDYRPIFDTARSALHACAQDNNFSAAVKGVALAALRVTRNIAGLRHDLLGRIFHRVLDTARYDGSFYTSTAAATFLANLAIQENMCDWSNSRAIGRLRITDPACGTGTLLMAAAERIRDLSSMAHDSVVSRVLIENVLTGYDANLTATHLAATTLGLLSPTTTFKEMKIGRAFLGLEHGRAYLGSLEFLSDEGFPQMIPWPSRVEQIDSAQEIVSAEPADVVIMNPPFTVNKLRHDQFTKEEEKALKHRERELFAGQPVHLSSNGNTFVVLADLIAKSHSSVVASVLPIATATNASALGIRKFLAKKFHVETIITSHDPIRKYFSENTTITEMLMVCRRWPRDKAKPATQFINLYENPSTPNKAMAVAKDISEGRIENINGSVQDWIPERIEAGNWGAVQFLSPFLCERFLDLKVGQYFSTRELGQMSTISPDGRGIRNHFKKSETPDANAMTARWDHKTTHVQRLSVEHDTYIVPINGHESQAAALWAKRGTLLLAMRARLNTVRTVSVRLPHRGLGSAWVPCKPTKEPYAQDTDHWVEVVEKAICAYLNSTLGILALVGNRSIRDLSYSQFSMDDLNKVSVPDFANTDKQEVVAMASAYDALCNKVLLPLRQMEECETRKALDDAMISALDIHPEIVTTIRRELTREPAITNKPYERE